jgi:exodeoxyribonuclease VII small subunit
MKRLEEIVGKLEEEQVPLEESMRLYEEGMKLGRRCRRILDEADERIRKLAEQKDGEEDDEE